MNVIRSRAGKKFYFLIYGRNIRETYTGICPVQGKEAELLFSHKYVALIHSQSHPTHLYLSQPLRTKGKHLSKDRRGSEEDNDSATTVPAQWFKKNDAHGKDIKIDTTEA